MFRTYSPDKFQNNWNSSQQATENRVYELGEANALAGIQFRNDVGKRGKKNKRRKGGSENQERALLMR